jgi:hypothetical protein
MRVSVVCGPPLTASVRLPTGIVEEVMLDGLKAFGPRNVGVQFIEPHEMV